MDEVLRISTEITNGLAHIHDCRILYLDLQPQNVRFDKWHKIHLLDFDTALSLDDTSQLDLSQRPVNGYMAPELLEKARADKRADLYSLGATIYEMCQGYPPFGGAFTEIQAARGTTPLPRLDRDDLPEDLQDLVFSLLASQPEHRPASAAEVLARLESIRAGKSTPTPKAGDSQPFPRPDPAELQASAATMAADYDVGDVIDDRFQILEIIDQGGFSRFTGSATSWRPRNEPSSCSTPPPVMTRFAANSAPCGRSATLTWSRCSGLARPAPGSGT